MSRVTKQGNTLVEFNVVVRIKFILLLPNSVGRYLMIRSLFIAVTTSYLEKSSPAEAVFCDSMFLWISSNPCSLNLLLVRSLQTEIIIAKCLIQERNNVIRVRVEPSSCNQGRRCVTHSTTLPSRRSSAAAYFFAETTVVMGSMRIAADCPGGCDESSAQFRDFTRSFEESVNQVRYRIFDRWIFLWLQVARVMLQIRGDALVASFLLLFKKRLFFFWAICFFGL